MHALSLGASPPRSERVAHSLRSFAGPLLTEWPLYLQTSRAARGPSSHAPGRVRRASRALRAGPAAPGNPAARGLDQSADEIDRPGCPGTTIVIPDGSQHGDIDGPHGISAPRRSR